MESPQKDIIWLSEISIVIYKAAKRTGIENDKFIHFNLLAGTYSIDGYLFNSILIQKLRWQSYNKYKTGNHHRLKI